MRIWRRNDVSLQAVLDILAREGQLLKQSRKTTVKRVGDAVVKASAGPILAQWMKHTLARARYRRGWHSALFLHQRGIPAPKPIAHIEWGRWGTVWRHATVLSHIDRCKDVEAYYDDRAAMKAPRSELASYLSRLANAVNAFTNTGAVPTDLAGKNILTNDGEMFYFIDLDAVMLPESGAAYDETHRFQCHVQLYDSFVDRCDDELLKPFLKAMLPDAIAPFESWFARVKEAQAIRRARTVAAWTREGKVPR
jgi:hypothetical protein